MVRNKRAAPAVPAEPRRVGEVAAAPAVPQQSPRRPHNPQKGRAPPPPAATMSAAVHISNSALSKSDSATAGKFVLGVYDAGERFLSASADIHDGGSLGVESETSSSTDVGVCLDDSASDTSHESLAVASDSAVGSPSTRHSRHSSSDVPAEGRDCSPPRPPASTRVFLSPLQSPSPVLSTPPCTPPPPPQQQQQQQQQKQQQSAIPTPPPMPQSAEADTSATEASASSISQQPTITPPPGSPTQPSPSALAKKSPSCRGASPLNLSSVFLSPSQSPQPAAEHVSAEVGTNTSLPTPRPQATSTAAGAAQPSGTCRNANPPASETSPWSEAASVRRLPLQKRSPKSPAVVQRTYGEREQGCSVAPTLPVLPESGYCFHLNESSPSASEEQPEPEDGGFAGVRDLLEAPDAIRSSRGTVRGVRNRVRAGIATFLLDNPSTKGFKERERGRLVLYVTTMGVVRSTYARCLRVRQILRQLMVVFDERDLFLSTANQEELRTRLGSDDVQPPLLFLEGQLLGSTVAPSSCVKCGGFRMLPCTTCNGSKKSVHRNYFTSEWVILRCCVCDESGLVTCDLCRS